MVSLADAFARRGFFEDRAASIGWDEYRSFTWSGGTVVSDINPLRREGVGLGYDTRWLWPVLPNTRVRRHHERAVSPPGVQVVGRHGGDRGDRRH